MSNDTLCNVCVVWTQGQTHGQFGIAYAHSPDSERHGSFCFMYNPLFKQLPRTQDDAVSCFYYIFFLDVVQNPPAFVMNLIFVTISDSACLFLVFKKVGLI